MLAYEEGKPIGWISLGPREDFRALLASPHYRPQTSETGVWSIVCFLVDRYARRRGLAAALLSAGLEHAFARGAAAVEAYPHRATNSDYMGSVPLYESAGFKRARDANKRAIYRLNAR